MWCRRHLLPGHLLLSGCFLLPWCLLLFGHSLLFRCLALFLRKLLLFGGGLLHRFTSRILYRLTVHFFPWAIYRSRTVSPCSHFTTFWSACANSATRCFSGHFSVYAWPVINMVGNIPMHRWRCLPVAVINILRHHYTVYIHTLVVSPVTIHTVPVCIIPHWPPGAPPARVITPVPGRVPIYIRWAIHKLYARPAPHVYHYWRVIIIIIIINYCSLVWRRCSLIVCIVAISRRRCLLCLLLALWFNNIVFAIQIFIAHNLHMHIVVALLLNFNNGNVLRFGGAYRVLYYQ